MRKLYSKGKNKVAPIDAYYNDCWGLKKVIDKIGAEKGGNVMNENDQDSVNLGIERYFFVELFIHAIFIESSYLKIKALLGVN